MTDVDVAIVGARCAGAPLAAMLAAQGAQVRLLDRAHFPSETPSTHVIQPCGAALLHELGVLDAVLAAGAVPLTQLTLASEDVRINATLDPVDYPRPGLCVRRVTLDALLVEAAAAAGADVRTGCAVTGLTRDSAGRVNGVVTDAGPVSARLVVGADGQHSTVATEVEAAEYLTTAPGRLAAWAYFDGAGRAGRLRLGRQGDYGFLAAPCDDGQYMAAVTLDIAQANAFRSNRDRCFADGLARWPELSDLLAGTERVGPIRMITNWHGYFRQSAGPGWVLVGDAGHFKDFTPGQGISDALRQAARLADVITRGLSGGDLDGELRGWWRWRDRDAHEMYWLAKDMGAPGTMSPLITEFLRGIADNAAATAQFVRVVNHDLSPARLFTPGRLAGAALRAMRARPDRIGATLRETAANIGVQARRTGYRYRRPAGLIPSRTRR